MNKSPGTLGSGLDKLLDKAPSQFRAWTTPLLKLYDGERFYAAPEHGASDEFAELLRQGYRAKRVAGRPGAVAVVERRGDR